MSSSDIMQEIRAKENEKYKYEMRRSQVGTLQGNIPSISDDYVKYINEKIDKVVEQLNAGIKGIDISIYTSQYEEVKESYADKDGSLSSAMGNLGAEEGDCGRKVDELSDIISDLYEDYERAVEEEEEARRIEEEAAAAAAKAATNGWA